MFLERQSFTLEWIDGCVHELYPLNRIVLTKPFVIQLVTEASLPVYRTCTS